MVDHSSEQPSSAEPVGSDLEAIRARLQTAQEELERIARQREDALARIAQLQVERAAAERNSGRDVPAIPPDS